jgi:hypothetical protein
MTILYKARDPKSANSEEEVLKFGVDPGVVIASVVVVVVEVVVVVDVVEGVVVVYS